LQEKKPARSDLDRCGNRDVIQNIYIRRVEKRDGRLVNVDFDKEESVKDPWKIDNSPK
jgi:hypothetical protein